MGLFFGYEVQKVQHLEVSLLSFFHLSIEFVILKLLAENLILKLPQGRNQMLSRRKLPRNLEKLKQLYDKVRSPELNKIVSLNGPSGTPSF